MFVLANLLSAIATVLDAALQFYMWMVIIRALLSWVNPDPYNAIVRFLNAATDPVLWRIRRWLGPRILSAMGGLDLSPIIVILAIYFLRAFLVQSLGDLALRLG
jgi:YggT family protein